MKDKVNNILRENNELKSELERLISLIKENEAKQKGFRLIEDAFLLAESMEEIDTNALHYIEEIFGIDKAVLFIDTDTIKADPPPLNMNQRVIYTDEKTLRYAYVEKRPYFGTYIEGLISDFHVIDHIGSYLIAPIMEEGRIIASLNMYSRDPEKLAGDGSADFIYQLSSRVAIALRKLHNMELIKNHAQKDYLTGVYNKGAMYNLLNRYIQRCKRNDTPFSFTILDMDNFKALNDAHGHIVGDNILKKFTSEVAKILVENETLGRFGGDEFYIISNRTTNVDIQLLFSKIADIVTMLATDYDMEDQVGISGGYILVPENIDINEQDTLDIVKGADTGLYYSKASGGGKITSGAVVKLPEESI